MATKTRRRSDKAQESHNQSGKSQKHSSGFSLDAKQIGVAVAGVLVTEIANIAVQKLSERIFKKDESSDLEAEDLNSKADKNTPNPIYTAAAQVGNEVGQAESSVGDVADAVRSSIGNLKISLSDVIDVLRDAGQQLKTQSTNAFNTSSEVVSENVSDTTTAMRDRVIPKAKSEFKKARKSKKNKSKKKNKKD